MTDKVKAWADGLRELADFADQHPYLFRDHVYYGETINLFAHTPEGMAEKTRQLGKSEKRVKGSWFCMVRTFGPHHVDLNIARDTFCERVQTGTKTVEKPDPEALKDVPTIEVEEAVYSWICPESVLEKANKGKVE